MCVSYVIDDVNSVVDWFAFCINIDACREVPPLSESRGCYKTVLAEFYIVVHFIC
jgi:hypothetical protein